jgi:tetratricopeptide (TPR) repeat protein
MPKDSDMNRHSAKSIALQLLLAVVLALAGNMAFAQAADCGKQRQVGTKALDEATWKQLNSVYEDVGDERYDDAYKDLQKMLSRAGRDVYLQSILYQALAQVEWSRENFDPALGYFEKAVELDSLPNQAHFSLMYQIAQLYFMKERYQDALDKLALWFCTVDPEKVTYAAYVLKASIYASMNNYAETLKAIDIAISMGEKPKEQWYQLKLAAHYELEQYPQAADTLEIIANSDVPYKAAKVLEKGINDGIVESSEKYWTAVADSWYAAEELENALAAYEKAGEAASDGDIDLRRGYILVDLERWPDAKDALNDALAKGGLNERKMGEAYLLRGMAQFNLGNFDSASSDWGKASRYPKTKAAAQQWINHLREERRRRAP